jgi:ABC-2 type transport system ATP-binding protein
MYNKIVEFAELEEFMEQKLKNYSSGMKVRLAFSVAVRADADILVLDEVLAVGDASFQKKCYEYFKTLKVAHKTIVFVSHSMGQVKEYCDRAILIEDGKIVFEVTGEDASSEYLRLFVKSKDSQASQSNEHWGTKAVQITKIDTLVNSSNVTFNLHTQAAGEQITKAILGIDIYDSDNKFVGGFESINLPNGQLNYQPHEKKTLTVTVDNIFGSGDFLATVALKSKGNIDIYDFWKHGAQFTNSTKRDPDRYFSIILPATINTD